MAYGCCQNRITVFKRWRTPAQPVDGGGKDDEGDEIATKELSTSSSLIAVEDDAATNELSTSSSLIGMGDGGCGSADGVSLSGMGRRTRSNTPTEPNITKYLLQHGKKKKTQI